MARMQIMELSLQKLPGMERDINIRGTYWATWVFHCIRGNERAAEKKSTSETTEQCAGGFPNTRSQTIALKIYASSVNFSPDADVKTLIKSGAGIGASHLSGPLN